MGCFDLTMNVYIACPLQTQRLGDSVGASAASSSMAPKSVRKASGDAGVAETRKRNAALNASLARGNALQRLRKNAAYDLTTPILPGTCDVSLGELMKTEKLSLADAVEVMLKFRREAGITDPDEVGLSLPPAAKPLLHTKAKHEPQHEDSPPPKSILKTGKSKNSLNAEPPEDDNDDRAAAAKANKKRKPEASSSKPRVSQGKAKAKNDSPEDTEPTSAAPSTQASKKKG